MTSRCPLGHRNWPRDPRLLLRHVLVGALWAILARGEEDGHLGAALDPEGQLAAQPCPGLRSGLGHSELHELWMESKDVSVDLKQWFRKLTLNVILRIVVGKHYHAAEQEEEQRCQKALRELFHFFGMFLPADSLPFLKWLDLGGHEKAMKRTAEELDKIVGGWLEEHKIDKDSGETNGGRDFMDVMLSVLNDDEMEGYDAYDYKSYMLGKFLFAPR
ncbi:uncharacterized protein J3R85_004521 [Psidium guajava]|nr:uncharacterized protein J3R85_004521 [Psidium guajava]